MRTRLLRLAVSVALAALTFGVVGPASAGELSHADQAKDVRYHDFSQGFETAMPGTELPRRRNGDLRRFSVSYGAQRIRVVLKFRELRRTQPVFVVSARFRWAGGGQLNYAEAVITATKGNRAGTAELSAEGSEDSSGRCQVRHRINYRANRVRLSFPARCFSTPPWIQFNAWVLATDDLEDPTYVLGDDVFPVMSDEPGEVERYTRRIRRS